MGNRTLQGQRERLEGAAVGAAEPGGSPEGWGEPTLRGTGSSRGDQPCRGLPWLREVQPAQPHLLRAAGLTCLFRPQSLMDAQNLRIEELLQKIKQQQYKLDKQNLQIKSLQSKVSLLSRAGAGAPQPGPAHCGDLGMSHPSWHRALVTGEAAVPLLPGSGHPPEPVALVPVLWCWCKGSKLKAFREPHGAIAVTGVWGQSLPGLFSSAYLPTKLIHMGLKSPNLFWLCQPLVVPIPRGFWASSAPALVAGEWLKPG